MKPSTKLRLAKTGLTAMAIVLYSVIITLEIAAAIGVIKLIKWLL